MAALAAPDDETFRAWTTSGIEFGDREPAAAYWRGPLLNNLGWRLHERGADEEALSVFERALEVREEDRSGDHATEIARYAVAVALRALGRPAEAARRAEQAVDWSLGTGTPAPFFHQELAEDYAALGRGRTQRRRPGGHSSSSRTTRHRTNAPGSRSSPPAQATRPACQLAQRRA